MPTPKWLIYPTLNPIADTRHLLSENCATVKLPTFWGAAWASKMSSCLRLSTTYRARSCGDGYPMYMQQEIAHQVHLQRHIRITLASCKATARWHQSYNLGPSAFELKPWKNKILLRNASVVCSQKNNVSVSRCYLSRARGVIEGVFQSPPPDSSRDLALQNRWEIYGKSSVSNRRRNPSAQLRVDIVCVCRRSRFRFRLPFYFVCV